MSSVSVRVPDVFNPREIADAAGVRADVVRRMIADGGIATVDGQFVATPDAVRAAWSSASLIHVATHASRDLDEPRRSGVQLGAGSWTAFDVAREGMAADLVVLSGCRTGDAVVWGGDEAFGLLPALREAGDAAVLVSLWAVEDGAADAWMQRFHGALAAGTPAAAAWQVAVAESRSRADSAYHWAPFALYGQRWSQGR